MAFVISISSGKGGVAKTTTCLSLGCSLAEMGHRVLLIDLDHNANLTLGFGAIPTRAATFSKDLFIESHNHIIQCLKSDYKNLDIIPSDGNLNFLEERSLSIHNSTMVLRLALKSAFAGSYDFIIIDCPASLGYLTTNALTASDLLIVPTQAEFFSAYSLQTMFSLIREIRLKKNPDLKYRILITLLDLRLRDHLNILNQLQKHLGESLYKTKILVDTHFRESHTQGVPIIYSMPNSRGAIQFRELAQELIHDLPEEDKITQDQVLMSQPVQPVQMEMNTPNQISKNVQNPTKNTLLTAYQNPSWPATPISISQKQYQENKGLFCPHLGKGEDPQTMFSYPSTWNRCYRAKPVVSPSFEHQKTCCISNHYQSCPMLNDKKKRSLPSNLRAPMDTSEFLKYLTSWVRTIIS